MRITKRFFDSNANQDGYLVDGILVWVPAGSTRAQAAQLACDQLGINYQTFLAWWNKLQDLDNADTQTASQILTAANQALADANAATTLAQAKTALVELATVVVALINKAVYLEGLAKVENPSVT